MRGHVCTHTHSAFVIEREQAPIGSGKQSGTGSSLAFLARSTRKPCCRGRWGARWGRSASLTFPPGFLAPTLTFQASSLRAPLGV